jgi:putative ABC transport system permease protein
MWPMHDIRYACRLLTSRPGFAFIAVLTLALGIGANTAIFTVVNAVLLRPLAFRDPGRLVLLVERTAAFPTVTTSWQNYQDWRDGSRSFETVAAMRPLTMTLSGVPNPERVPAKMVSASLLPMLGVAPQLGRALAQTDDKAGAAGVALLSEALWHRRFGGSVDVIGRAVTLDNTPYTIVGVLPPQFQLLAAADVLLPMGPWAATLPDDRNWHPGIFPLARLKPGVTMAQAQAEMDVITERLAAAYPEFDHGVSAEVKPLHDYAVQNVRQSLLVLVAAVGFVLLIACANVANLLLARAVGRQREMAIRTAIGASRARIAMQLLTESMVLALVGGATGLLLAFWSVPLLAQLAGASATPAAPIGIDPAALAFTLVVSIATGFAFGVFPALQTAQVNVTSAINDAGRGSAAGVGHHRMRAFLVVAEMALATMLLVGAGLLAKSLVRLQEVSPGFNPAHVLLAEAPLSPTTYATPQSRNAFVDRVLAGLRGKPGVTSADIATAPPFSGAGSAFHFNISGRPPKGPEEYIITSYRAVTNGFFATLGVPVVAGRAFTDRDRDKSKPVAIVNETFVKQFYPQGFTLGAQINAPSFGGGHGPAATAAIVGVVADIRARGFESAAQPLAYFPLAQQPRARLSAVLQFEGDSAALVRAVTMATHKLDADLALDNPQTLEQQLAKQTAPRRVTLMLTGAFAATAVLLAALGIFGVMSYTVTQRTQEIGVRMALGADANMILRWMLRYGVGAVGIGLVIGLALTAATTRLLTTLFVGVTALDPMVVAAGVGVLAFIGLVACVWPAWLATRVNPVNALRNE